MQWSITGACVLERGAFARIDQVVFHILLNFKNILFLFDNLIYSQPYIFHFIRLLDILPFDNPYKTVLRPVSILVKGNCICNGKVNILLKR